jgi:hypothetical protein
MKECSNSRVEFVPYGHPTRKTLRLLLAAHAGRSAGKS